MRSSPTKAVRVAVPPKFCLQRRQRNGLVLDAHNTVADAQQKSMYQCGTALPTAEQGDFQSRLLQHPDTKTISHIEAFNQVTIAGEAESSIGGDAMHIEHKQ